LIRSGVFNAENAEDAEKDKRLKRAEKEFCLCALRGLCVEIAL